MLLTLRLKKSYEITIVALLAAMAVVGRIALQPIPNFQPATFVIIIGGIYFGKKVGTELGLVVGIVSGLLTGIGSWTIFQIAGWMVVGFISGMFDDKDAKWKLATWFFVSAFVYGFIASLSALMFVPLSGFPAYIASGLIFDLYHAISNIALIATIPLLSPVLKKVRSRGTTLLPVQ